MNVRFSKLADADITSILKQTKERFGPLQVHVYAGILERALAMIADNPMRPSSDDCSDIRPGLRALHLALAARRHSAAVHRIYFVVRTGEAGQSYVFVARVLHERMEPRSRLARALRQIEPGTTGPV